MVITPRAGGLGLGCPLGCRWGAPLTSSRSPWSWALQLLPAWSGQCWAREDPKGDPAALLPKSWDCSLHAGVAGREEGGWGAGEGREAAPSPPACEAVAPGRAGTCDGSCLLSATIKALEQ